MKIFFILFYILSFSYINAYDEVQLIKHENNDSNTTLLVIGGIHGDEPGGYFSPSILASHYKITSKNLWIIPNLNKESIQQNKRGIYGDMNRKFAAIKSNDHDKKIIKEIKQIILSPKVSLILNLHDGHGFYRKKSNGYIFNPTAWGQTCVIDQCKLSEKQPFGNLNEIAQKVKEKLNKHLIEKHHIFNIKNTKTKYDDEAMQLSLTYFAVTNNKPAFAIESSKNLSHLYQKVFYQLSAIEEFMKIVGIKFDRDFELNENEIKKILQEYGTLTINNNISLNLNKLKNNLNYIPMKSNSNNFVFSNNLGTIKKNNGSYSVYIGNKKITTLRPQYFKIPKQCSKKFKINVDGKDLLVDNSDVLSVNNFFNVYKNKDYRVNVIGFSKYGLKDESDVNIRLNNLSKKYSIDKENKIYRIEFYKNNYFCKTIMAKFI